VLAPPGCWSRAPPPLFDLLAWCSWIQTRQEMMPTGGAAHGVFGGFKSFGSWFISRCRRQRCRQVPTASVAHALCGCSGGAEVAVAVGDSGGMHLILKTLAFDGECKSSSSACGRKRVAWRRVSRVVGNPWLFSTTMVAMLPRHPHPEGTVEVSRLPHPSLPINSHVKTLGSHRTAAMLQHHYPPWRRCLGKLWA
jgi:hypothetical protein